jgi:hypothetical protein
MIMVTAFIDPFIQNAVIGFMVYYNYSQKYINGTTENAF